MDLIEKGIGRKDTRSCGMQDPGAGLNAVPLRSFPPLLRIAIIRS
jgi:hypothetical protein